jgi:hypothetical protein
MKCSNVRKEIDRMVYHPDPVHDVEINHHIDSCKDCARYLEETRLVAGRIAGLSRRVPVLKNPERLTEEIMKAIRENPKISYLSMTEKSGKSPVIIILLRFLAAASVCLFLVFAYEEYVVVDKISRLEKQNAAISQSSQYQATLKLKKAIGILTSDPEILNRYKEIKAGKINLRTLLRAAMYADVAGITPDALKWLDRTDYHIADSPFMSIIEQFDANYHTEQQ